ncbi:MAG: thiamine-phosphate kinase [Myxococcota bacterium]|jgi:thiamine-monophosphate kinase|nr:thiamine-phosphate kinase [Myxococcota bacterium]
MKDDPGEASVIAALTDSVTLPDWVRHGPGDDAAILDDGQVLTTDLLVEGVHFDHRIGPEQLAWKLVAVNASDVASCGARSTWALLSIALPNPIDSEWLNRFSGALKHHLSELGIALIGGDTTRSPHTKVINLCLSGTLESAPLLRSTAGPDEDIWVSGTLGDASAGFHQRSPELEERWHCPQPPLDLGPALAKESLASSAMDLSDGLLQDLRRLCKASGVGAEIDPERLPTSSALRDLGEPLLSHQLGFGEDYQLLFTAHPSDASQVLALGETLGVQLTRIGKTTSNLDLVLPGADAVEVWTHFRGDP